MEHLTKLLRSHRVRTIIVSLAIVCLTGTMLCPAAFSANGQADSRKLVQQVVAKWIQIGSEQYERGYYKASEQSFLRAKDYEDHLSASQRANLDALLSRAHSAASQGDQVGIDIAAAQQLLAQGRVAEAKAIFEGLRNSQYLSAEQKQIIEKGLAGTTGVQNPEQGRIATLYNRSVDYYNTGDLENARKGFLEVSKSGLMVAPIGSRAEDYLAQIDAVLLGQVTDGVEIELLESTGEVAVQQPVAEYSSEPIIAQPGYDISVGESTVVGQQVSPVSTYIPDETFTPVVAESTQQDGYIGVINQRQELLRSHTKAVVNDAVTKAGAHAAANEYDQARKAVEYAQNLVNKNRLYLGEDIFAQYSDQLNSMRDSVDSSESSYKAQRAELAKQQATQAQRVARDKMEQDRINRIEQLQDNADNFIEQQRYAEALGQIHSLLALDPLHNRGLIMKTMLEDTIAFRSQLEVVKEKQRERTDLLLETYKSEVPHARELTYSKNWLEISEKRVPKEAIGQDPETARVYEQLEQIVDFSGLTSDMPLSEAIEILRRSVDPELRVFVNWRDLYDNADIDKDTPINMDPISAIKLSSAMKLLLEAVSGGFAELGYGVENGVITIATQESIPTDLVTLIYDVTDLVGEPANYQSTSGSGGGGGSGDSKQAGGGFQDQDQDERDSDETEEDRTGRMGDLIALIQDTINPDSWFEVGGEGTVTDYSSRLLSVRQTAKVHNEINALLKELRKAHGYQVAIEARFLKVQENFLEEIGLDIDFEFEPGGKFSPITVNQSSDLLGAAQGTGVDGSLGLDDARALTLSGGYGTLLDDLRVSFILRATQGHQDSTLITAPKATVLSGESASFRIEKYLYYASDIEIESTESGADVAGGFVTVNYEDSSVVSGTILNISPTISPDKKHVLLDINVQLNDFLGFRNQIINLPAFGVTGSGDYTIEFPQTEVAQVRTRVSVPDGGTLLLGGQKLGAEVEKESGVPVLSKIPVLGRAFSNRSKVKDHKILLILVKPTIILQEETEADAIAELRNRF